MGNYSTLSHGYSSSLKMSPKSNYCIFPRVSVKNIFWYFPLSQFFSMRKEKFILLLNLHSFINLSIHLTDITSCMPGTVLGVGNRQSPDSHDYFLVVGERKQITTYHVMTVIKENSRIRGYPQCYFIFQGQDRPDRMTFEKCLEAIREQTILVSGRILQTEGTGRAEVLRKKHTCHI